MPYLNALDKHRFSKLGSIGDLDFNEVNRITCWNIVIFSRFLFLDGVFSNIAISPSMGNQSWRFIAQDYDRLSKDSVASY